MAPVRVGVLGRWGQARILGAVFVLLALVPLAHASPPDPVWLAGIYDAGDSDDVIFAAVSLVGWVIESVGVYSDVSLHAQVVLPTDSRLPEASPRSPKPRAP